MKIVMKIMRSVGIYLPHLTQLVSVSYCIRDLKEVTYVINLNEPIVTQLNDSSLWHN